MYAHVGQRVVNKGPAGVRISPPTNQPRPQGKRKSRRWILCSSSHFSQRDHIEGCKRRECFHLDNPGGSALLSRRQTGNWTPMAAIRLCTSQCPIRRRSYSLVADSDNPQISAA